MKASAILLVLAFGAGCGARTPAITTPLAVMSDAESERLHDRCEVRAVRMLDAEQVDANARAVGANFAELVYRPDRAHFGVVFFRCL